MCRDRGRLGELSKVGPWAGHLAGAAVAIALVTPDPRGALDPRGDGAPLSIMWDLGRAAQNMVLAAWELGIGSAPATVYEHDRARELLGYPDDQHCEYILSFGYPADADRPHPPTEGRRPTRPRRDGPRRALVGRPTATGTCAPRSRSRRPASRAGPRRRPRVARTRRPRPSPGGARRQGRSAG